ncbi:MAG: hypothetical protein ABJC74_14350 [Gemmatimonadota bacterium]
MPQLRISAYAVATPGLEPLVAAELTALGFSLGKSEPGGVAFACDRAGLYRANLELRTATRVLVRVAAFRAVGFNELEKHGKRIAWETLLGADASVGFRVTSKKSRLYHGGAIEERLGAIIGGRMPGVRFETGEAGEVDTTDDIGRAAGPNAQLIIVRLFRDQCTISLDSSGELLHRRGYRQAGAKAPIRENLAAALLIAAGWDRESELLDPMCGSGTIPIEAALMARRIPPGWRRGFGFERWPDFEPNIWTQVRTEAEARILAALPGRISGSDRDSGAIKAAIANAERAGVAGDVSFTCSTISAIEPRTTPGWLVTNPPYGVRVGEREKLRNLFAQFGNVVRSRLPGWQVAFLSSHASLEGETKLRLESKLEFSNGGISVRLMAGPAE